MTFVHGSLLSGSVEIQVICYLKWNKQGVWQWQMYFYFVFCGGKNDLVNINFLFLLSSFFQCKLEFCQNRSNHMNYMDLGLDMEMDGSCVHNSFFKVLFFTEQTKPGRICFLNLNFARGFFLIFFFSGSGEQRRGPLRPGCQQPSPFQLAALCPWGSIPGTEEPGSHPGRVGGFLPFASCYWFTNFISSLAFVSCNKIVRSEQTTFLFLPFFLEENSCA